jgi:hypothetical protein
MAGLKSPFWNPGYLMFRIRNTAAFEGRLPGGRTEQDLFDEYCKILAVYPRQTEGDFLGLVYVDTFPPDLRQEITADCRAAVDGEQRAVEKLSDLDRYCRDYSCRIEPNQHEQEAFRRASEMADEEIRFQEYLDSNGMEFLQRVRHYRCFRSIMTLLEAAEEGEEDADEMVQDAAELGDMYENSRWS